MCGRRRIRSLACVLDGGGRYPVRKRNANPVLTASPGAEWTAIPHLQISKIQAGLRPARVSAHDGRRRTYDNGRPHPGCDQVGRVAAALERPAGGYGPRGTTARVTGLHRLLPQWVREDSRTQARRFWSVSGNVPRRKQALPRRRGCDGFLPAGAVSSQGKDRPGLLPAPYSCFRSRLDSSRRAIAASSWTAFAPGDRSSDVNNSDGHRPQ